MKFRQEQPPLDVSDESWHGLLNPALRLENKYYLWKTIFFSFAAVHRDHGKPFVTIFASVKNSWESPPTVNIFSIYMKSYISIWHTIIKNW